jgi:NAD(P)-dependent dehydrogenase (short-subunit alcohol dehydrogenase family)
MAAQSGRVVLLTGAAGGIGRVMTAALLAAGHSVAAVDRDQAALDRLTARHGAASDRLHPIVADLGTEAGCQSAVAAARAKFGAIEAVINNAGIGMSSIRPDAEARAPGIEELTPQIWDGFMAIFVRAPVMLVRAALPDMKRGGFGRIVNNTTSYVTMLRVLPYGAAKAALESMSAVWAKELDGSGITVNVLVPGGPTDTALIARRSWDRPRHGSFQTRPRHLPAGASPPHALGREARAGGRHRAREPRHRLAGTCRRRRLAYWKQGVGRQTAPAD